MNCFQNLIQKLLALIIVLTIISCNTKPLPFLIGKSYNNPQKKSEAIPVHNFNVEDQIGKIVNNNTLKGNIYVTDFIFLSCPTICPIMTKNLLLVYNEFKNDRDIKFLSLSIDPNRDTTKRLYTYSNQFGIDPTIWHFTRGNQDSIMTLAKESFILTALKDSTIDGGFVHSGGLFLVDKNGYVRGAYNGTSQEDINKLKKDILILEKLG